MIIFDFLFFRFLDFQVITEQKAPDASPMLEATWSRQQMNSSGSYSSVPSSSLYKPLPRPNY